MKLDRKAGYILAIGGGKGGVGKSVFAVNLGTALAGLGKKVVLVDFDLGGANLHSYLGVTGRTLSLANFFLKKVSTLDEILLNTKVENLKLVSGSQYVSGMANPASWIKMKLIRHVRAIHADFVIIDLGAGTHFSTLDFFASSDKGLIITVPEPAAVMNAYRFIKGVLFRKLQAVFKNHREIDSLMNTLGESDGYEGAIMLKWLDKKVREIDPSIYPLIKEVSESFAPCLVINRMPGKGKNQLAGTLLKHCASNYNIRLLHLGNLPDTNEISKYLLNIPGFLKSWSGSSYQTSLNSIINNLFSELKISGNIKENLDIKSNFEDDEIDILAEIIDNLDETIFEGTSRNVWKLRLYFKPVQVVNFLIGKGVRKDIFFESFK